MFCPECGKEASGKFCCHCGSPLPNAETGNTVTSTNDSESHIQDDQLEAAIAAIKAARESSNVNNRSHKIQDDHEVRCPKCGSTSLSADKKGFGFGKATVGLLAAGPVGLLAGGIGSKGVMVTCLSCGHKFKAGKGM